MVFYMLANSSLPIFRRHELTKFGFSFQWKNYKQFYGGAFQQGVSFCLKKGPDDQLGH